MYQKMLGLFLVVGLIISCSLLGEVRGKVDLGGVVLYVDMLRSGKTQKTLKMYGVKADSTVLVYQGIALKPNIIYGEGGHGKILSGGIAIGQYIPLTKKVKILPNVGMTWGDFYAHVRLPEFGGALIKEKFRSRSPYIGCDISFSFAKDWTLIGSYQYAWSSTRTTIKPFFKDKSHSCGPNYAAAIEYAITEKWAVNLGAGYNITLSKEKHGLRGKGVKLGMAYYF